MPRKFRSLKTIHANGMETLESKTVLAATADIVFLLDESGSAAVDSGLDGEMMRPWLTSMIPDLETKLVSRGYESNRYGLITYGKRDGDDEPSDGTPLARSRQINTTNLFGSAANLLAFLAQNNNFYDDGGEEDLFAGFGVGTGLGLPGESIDGQYVFRSGAAVHFIAVADESRQVPQNNLTDPNIGDTDDQGGSLFSAMLDQLRAENIDTGESLEVLRDAIISTIAPFNFDEGSILGSTSSAIFGIDVHLLDSVNVDGNNGAELLVSNVDDNFTAFTWNSTSKVSASTKVGNAITQTGMKLMSDNYRDIRSAFEDQCTEENYGNCPINGDPDNEHWEAYYPMDDQFVDQENFEAEDYAFLTWESRGTTWDFDIIRSNWSFQNGDWNNGGFSGAVDNQIEYFTAAVVDDVFEKIRLQSVDFDGSGFIGDLNDEFLYFFNSAVALAAAIDDAITNDDPLPSYETYRQFDLDNDGVFVTVNGNDFITDQDDILRLVKVFATWTGDSNLDFTFTTSDNVAVFTAGEYDDSTENNSGWPDGDWNGDFDFNSSDLVFVFTEGGYEVGYADRDNDSHYDILPVWAWGLQSTFNGTLQHYLPDWET